MRFRPFLTGFDRQFWPFWTLTGFLVAEFLSPGPTLYSNRVLEEERDDGDSNQCVGKASTANAQDKGAFVAVGGVVSLSASVASAKLPQRNHRQNHAAGSKLELPRLCS